MNAATENAAPPDAGKHNGGTTGTNPICGNPITGPDSAQARAAAHEYIRRGWQPLPVAPPEAGNDESGKNPIPKGWQKMEVGESDIPALWPSGGRYNIGILTGQSGLVVLDFDEAFTYHDWASKHPEAAKSYTVARNNAEPGRCHVYFQLAPDESHPCNLTKKAVGWGDRLCKGRQVVAPPSVHYSGGIYEVIIAGDALPWKEEYTPAPLTRPEAVPPRQHTPAPPPRAGSPGIPPSVQAALDFGASKGTRNETLFSIMCQLRDEGHAEAYAVAYARQFGARCQPPLSDAETVRTVRSAYAAAPREPARNPNAGAYFGGEHSAGAGASAAQGEAPPQETEEWQPPVPLGDLSTLPPVWPWEVYPAPMRRLGEAVVSTMNVPAELPGIGILCAASIACGKLARVAIKADHLQYPNLYGMVAMPQASGKTPACRPIQKPLLARQKEMRERFRLARREWAGRYKVAKAQISAIEKQAAAGETDAQTLAANIAALEAVEDERPIEPVKVADNATPEALARLLAENGGAVGVFTPDGRDILQIALGKYTKNGGEDFAVWLKAHDGEPFAFHRANRDALPFFCDEAVLAAFVAVQPDAMKLLGKNPAMRESGFLARWLYAVPERCPNDEYPLASIPPEIVAAYSLNISRLLDMAPDSDMDGNPVPHICPLGQEARELWRAFHAETKREADKAPALLAGCLGKLPEHVARIALVFHLAECAEHGRPPGPIVAGEIRRAIAMGQCLAAHIRRAVEMLGDTPERSQARQLLPILKAHRFKLQEWRAAEGMPDMVAVKPRDVVRGGWAGLEDADAARKVLDHLEVRGWLRRRIRPPKGFARDHELYELNPAIWEQVAP